MKNIHTRSTYNENAEDWESEDRSGEQDQDYHSSDNEEHFSGNELSQKYDSEDKRLDDDQVSQHSSQNEYIENETMDEDHFDRDQSDLINTRIFTWNQGHSNFVYIEAVRSSSYS